MVPSYSLDLSWFIFNKDHWHVADGNSTEIVLDVTLDKVFENYMFQNTATWIGG